MDYINLGRWGIEGIKRMIQEASSIGTIQEKIALISGCFLGTPYKASTLIGNGETEEVFVINLESVDCFTFIDYVEAMRLSNDFHDFKRRLKFVRYRSGIVSYTKRNHFFTDWIEYNKSVVDITRRVGGDNVFFTEKILNIKEDGTYILKGIEPHLKTIFFIPPCHIKTCALPYIQTGDYCGIYSESPGLDVSHVGIIIKTPDEIFFRHASSNEKHKKVIDEKFIDYIEKKSGVVILRPILIQSPYPYVLSHPLRY